MCACQSKGTTQCNLGIGCGQFCDPNLTSSQPCPCSGLTTNAVVYGAPQTIQKTATQAQAELANSNVLILNKQSVNAQVDPSIQLNCCMGNSNLNPIICQDYWGRNTNRSLRPNNRKLLRCKS